MYPTIHHPRLTSWEANSVAILHLGGRHVQIEKISVAGDKIHRLGVINNA